MTSDFDPTDSDPRANEPGSSSEESGEVAPRGREPGPASPPPSATPYDGLFRPRRGRMVAGVAAGIGWDFDVDPLVVRLGFVVLALFGGLGVPLYLAGWLLMPDEGADQSVAEYLLRPSADPAVHNQGGTR